MVALLCQNTIRMCGAQPCSGDRWIQSGLFAMGARVKFLSGGAGFLPNGNGNRINRDTSSNTLSGTLDLAEESPQQPSWLLPSPTCCPRLGSPHSTLVFVPNYPEFFSCCIRKYLPQRGNLLIEWLGARALDQAALRF